MRCCANTSLPANPLHIKVSAMLGEVVRSLCESYVKSSIRQLFCPFSWNFQINSLSLPTTNIFEPMIPRLLLTTCLALLSSMQAMSQIPKVATDTLFARGATMAFGRIKSVSPNGGSAIQIRGFCLSENPEPTVDDIINTRQFTNNGIIYYFEDLKSSAPSPRELLPILIITVETPIRTNASTMPSPRLATSSAT